MKNSQKFKTPEERAKAFEKFCHKNSGLTDCHKCPLESLMPDCGDSRAQFAWLDLEAEEEELLPCPFCGGKTLMNYGHLIESVEHHWVYCVNLECMYRSANHTNKQEAIDAHNEVSKAVMSAKESRAKHD